MSRESNRAERIKKGKILYGLGIFFSIIGCFILFVGPFIIMPAVLRVRLKDPTNFIRNMIFVAILMLFIAVCLLYRGEKLKSIENESVYTYNLTLELSDHPSTSQEKVVKCDSCGAESVIIDGEIVQCEYCGSHLH